MVNRFPSGSNIQPLWEVLLHTVLRQAKEQEGLF